MSDEVPFSFFCWENGQGDFQNPPTTAENQLESRSAGPSSVAGQHEEAAGHTCKESARSTLAVPSARRSSVELPPASASCVPVRGEGARGA